MKQFLKINSKGFTLIEVLVVLALIAVISIPIMMALITGLKIYDKEMQVDKVFQEQQAVFMTIKNQIRENPDKTVVTVDSNGSSTLDIGEGTAKISYYLMDQSLNQIQSGTTRVVLSGVNTFELKNITKDSNNHLLSFTLSMKVTTGERTQTLTSDFALSRY